MRSTLVSLALFCSIAACGGSSGDDSVPTSDAGAANAYAPAPNTATVVAPNAAPSVGATSNACGPNEHADVIVDSTGKTVKTICSAASAAPTPIDGNGNIDIGKDNKGVVVIDGQDDGVDVAGDVKSDGNNVTLAGAGPAVSVIGGSVDADGNNFTGRGVTVKGNVTIDGNNASFVASVIEGDLIIKGNNAVVAGCTVLGRIEIDGNNAVLVGNKVSKGIEAGDHASTCDSNVDANGAAITCGSGGKK